MDTALVKRSWDLYLKNIGILLGATIVAGLMCCTIILAGPALMGLMAIMLKVVRGEKPEFNELFAHFDKLVPSLIPFLIFGAVIWLTSAFIAFIPIIGTIIAPGITYILGAMLFMSMVAVLERNTELVPSLQYGVGYMTSRPALMILFGGYGLATGLLSFVLSFSWVLIVLFGWIIGLFSLFIAPMFALVLATAYHEGGSTSEAKADMKTLQIVGIGLAAAIVLGLVFMVVRGPVRQVGGIFGGRARSGFTRSGEPNFTLSGKDDKGNKVSLGFGSSIPKSFPKDVPIYKGAEVFSSSENREEGSVTVMATVDDKADNIRQYYYSELERRGWEINQESSGIFGSIIAVKNDRQAVVVVMGDDDEDTSLSITVGKVSE